MYNPVSFKNFWLVAVLLLAAAFPAWSATKSVGPIQVRAEVPATSSLRIVVLDASSNEAIEGIDFGTVSSGAQGTEAQREVKVVAEVNVNEGTPYQLMQEFTGLKHDSSNDVMPVGALRLEPFYEEELNGGLPMPSEAALGRKGPAVAIKRLYQDPTGQPHTISVLYSLRGRGSSVSEKELRNQKSGRYSGTVQFTLVTD